MSRTGRPKIEIDQTAFERLCELQCTENEIAAWFGASVDTLGRWCKRMYGVTFADVFEQKRKAGHISLRRYQFQQAETNATMAIWLGKQWLGQKDAMDANVTIGNPLRGLSEEELRLLAKSNGTTENTNSG